MSRPDAAPGSTASLRTANQHRVLDVLREGSGTYTQAELARTTGLAPATVSGIVRELAQRGILETTPGSGRRGSSVRVAPGAGVVAGVDFGHQHVAVAVGDLTGAVLAEDRRRLDGALEHHEALAVAKEMLDQLLEGRATLRTLGLGLPAPLDGAIVRSDAIFPGWAGVDAGSVSAEAFGVPVHVENDANLGAVAEHRVGAGAGHDSSVFVKTSSGVGAGIIVANELFHGANGTAGEIGHLTLDETGPVCRCGKRGCLEAYTSTPFMAQRLTGQVAGAEDVDNVVAAAREGNVAALRALEEAGTHLGRGLAAVVNLINPSLVIVGGDMARAGDLLLDSVRVGLRRHALASTASHSAVLAAELGDRASVIGALLLALHRTELVPAGGLA